MNPAGSRFSAANAAPPPRIHSSASSTRHQAASVSARAALRAAAKSSTHGKCATRAPQRCAIGTVASAEPVSSTSISSTQGRALSRQRSMQRASSRTIITSAIRCGVEGDVSVIPESTTRDGAALPGTRRRRRRFLSDRPQRVAALIFRGV